jgi:adenylate cyclase
VPLVAGVSGHAVLNIRFLRRGTDQDDAMAGRFAAGLAYAQIVAGFEVGVIVISLRGKTVAAAAVIFSEKNAAIALGLLVIAALTAAVGGRALLAPSLRWFGVAQRPNANQRWRALTMPRRQSVMLGTTWIVGAGFFLLANIQGGRAVVGLIGFAALFGGIAAVFTGLVNTRRTLRPLLAAATSDADQLESAAGVRARLLVAWILCGALPAAGAALLIGARASGWVLEKSATVEAPILMFSLAAALVGLRAMVLVSRSISDPVREMVEAMAEVERGRRDAAVSVYERGEIGALQYGFNRMVTGLRERDRLRDLFGRYVGADVARRAIDRDEALSGEVRTVSILFIDLVGSTELATLHPPEQVASVLNEFFRVVVATVDERHGLVNKFQGDAVLAVFGAPLPSAHPESAALSTARALGAKLSMLSMVDFGIGISAGPVFAGNVGAENRYEYTVIGDAVNEAARLAELAKAAPARILCSATALSAAEEQESDRWTPWGSATLRGRSALTQISTPREVWR